MRAEKNRFLSGIYCEEDDISIEIFFGAHTYLVISRFLGLERTLPLPLRWVNEKNTLPDTNNRVHE